MTRHITSIAAVFALVAAACSGSSAETTSTTVGLTTLATVTTTTTTPPIAPATTTLPPSTTTTIPMVPSPLNGLGIPEADAELVDRPVVAVKIDNHPDARPQSGLQDADAVMELLVEGGLTRFIALFLQSDSSYIGPIRSLRPTDPTLVKPLGAVLQISGGQAWVKSRTRGMEVAYIGETSPNTFRIPRNGRAYERTLFGTTDGMRERIERLDVTFPTVDWLRFGEATAGTEPAISISLKWSNGTTVRWEHDGGRYLRFAGEEAHNWADIDGNEEQVAFDTLLMIGADPYRARPGSGQSGSSLPAVETVGAGEAFVFHSGEMVKGTWSREDVDEAFDLRLEDGTPITLPPGRLWISVFPATGSLTWE